MNGEACDYASVTDMIQQTWPGDDDYSRNIVGRLTADSGTVTELADALDERSATPTDAWVLFGETVRKLSADALDNIADWQDGAEILTGNLPAPASTETDNNLHIALVGNGETMTTELTDEHREALDTVYSDRMWLGDIEDDQVLLQLYDDLQQAGLVIIDNDSAEVWITDAGRAYLDNDEGEDEETAGEQERDAYGVDYTSFLDTFHDAPVHQEELADDDWEPVNEFIANGHLEGPDEDGYLHITEAGTSLLNAE